MKLHLLLTPEIDKTKPETCKIIADFGFLQVIFKGLSGKDDHIESGTHCFIEDTEENIVKWLKPFDGFVKGNGNPMMESFTIAHIA